MILDNLPEFNFSFEDKRDVLNQSVLKSFDGTFEYLVEFQAQLKNDYFVFQNAKCSFFQLLGKTLRAYSIAANFHKNTTVLDELTTVHTELRKVTISQYLTSNDNAINRPILFRVFPRFGGLIREFISHEIAETLIYWIWICVFVF